MKPTALDRLRAARREMGYAKTLIYLADRAIRRVHAGSGFYLYHFVAQPLAETPRLPAGRGKAYALRWLEAPEPVLDGLGRPAAVIAARFAQGARCLVATKGEALVGCIWFVRECYHEDEVRADYHLPAGGAAVWDFDVFVAESERLGFLFAKLWDGFDAALRDQGVRWTLSRINGFNQRSLASHRSLGARDCGWALFLRLGRAELMLSPLKPWLSVSRGRRPSLHLAPPGESRP
ncbi:MAG: N-acetyltransferase [Gammaproteobacteria bacterium]|nr:N-acetyltransferase [Gammaproteobacteria bacterium]